MQLGFQIYEISLGGRQSELSLADNGQHHDSGKCWILLAADEPGDVKSWG
jgi:hypothetical protein